MRKKKTEKGSFREMMALDKAHMLPLNFAYSYIMLPIYAAVSVILLIVFSSVVQANSLISSAICLGSLALLSAGIVLMRIYVNKRAIKTELKRYDIPGCLKKVSDNASRDEWDFSDEELNVRCKAYGMEVNGTLYYYNHLRKAVITSNEYRRVTILICFVDSSDRVTAMPLNEKTLKMLKDFDVKLDNQPVLDEILYHPAEAFAEIYKTGDLKV